MHVYLHQPTSHTHAHAQFSARTPASARNSHAHKHLKTSFEKNCFSARASTLNMGLINKVDMVCLSPVGYGV